MTSLGMEVAGMCTQSHLNMINTISYVGQCTNGEWNSLRCKGNTRPLSVLQIRADSRRKYANMSQLVGNSNIPSLSHLISVIVSRDTHACLSFVKR